MISEVITRQGAPALTSDCWHVVHAHFTDKRRRLPFLRKIVSEHADRAACVRAARALRATLGNGDLVPEAQRDEVFVRRPNYKSLKRARRRRTEPPAS